MQQYTRTMAALLITIGLTYLINPAFGSAGVKDYGDTCNVLSSGIQFFDTISGGDRNYAGACDLEKGLICALGNCACLPNQQYEQNLFEKLTGGGKCVGSGASSVSIFSATFMMVIAIPILSYYRFWITWWLNWRFEVFLYIVITTSIFRYPSSSFIVTLMLLRYWA